MKSLLAVVVALTFAAFTVQAQEKPSNPKPVYLEASDCLNFYQLVINTSKARQNGFTKEQIQSIISTQAKIHDERHLATTQAAHGLVEAIYDQSPEEAPEPLARIAYDACMKTYMTGQL